MAMSFHLLPELLSHNHHLSQLWQLENKYHTRAIAGIILFVRSFQEALQSHRVEWIRLNLYMIRDAEKSGCRRERFFQKDIT